MTTHLRLQKLFRSLAAGSLAASAAGCGGSSPLGGVELDQSICAGEESFGWVKGLTPQEPVDYVAYREISPWGATLRAEEGTPCFGTTDAESCLEALEGLPTDEGIFRGKRELGPVVIEGDDRYRDQIVYTRGEEARVITDIEGLRAFLGTIDTAQEAALVALMERDYRFEVVCEGDDARAAPEGIYILLQEGGGCWEDYERKEHLILVRSDGSSEILETRSLGHHQTSCAIGRMTTGLRLAWAPPPKSVGEHLAQMAALEASAVCAFRRLAEEMRALGAPAELVLRALEAAEDEERHAVMVGLEARRRGAVVPEVASGPMPTRTAVEVALENAREGMVRETYGALAATYHAAAAKDERLSKMFARIAEDETRHAALAIDFGAFLEGVLSEEEREAVRAAREDAARGLADEVAQGLSPEVHRELGWPTPEVARELVARAFPAAWG